MIALKKNRRPNGPLVCVPIYSVDLNTRNVLWGIAPLDNLNIEDKYKFLGRPKKLSIPYNTWRQGELVKPMEVPESLLTEKIYLSDFGMAIKAGTEVKHKVHSPVKYRAPELFHNANPSFASDMWSYMCLFVELYFGVSAIHGNGSVSLVSYVVNVLGPLPKQWKGRYNGGGTSDDSWYDQSRKLRPFLSLEAFFDYARPETSPTERNLVLSIMSQGFHYLPERRITATQLLQDSSFKALMDIYCR
jgi:serine/threonine protein kinase